MKQTPDQARILARMAPGVLCREGFLGTDTRPLPEILDADNAAVDRLGTTHEALADALGDVLDKAKAGLGREVRVGGQLLAVWHEAMGRIPSPWPGAGTFPKGEVELTDTATGETLRVTPLSVHLIRRHGFYQGRGCRYRLDPAQLRRILRPALPA